MLTFQVSKWETLSGVGKWVLVANPSSPILILISVAMELGGVETELG